ncbi:hypothetical protein [Actinocrispum sp. NPDC049592]|uniref:hypothetical protein n=1 Tax=Actinocrispum sp. NPDC049592 TaxID=3154835 RepID=UPI00342933AB
MNDEVPVDGMWRGEMLSDLTSGDSARSTRALLSLTLNDPGRVWLEDLLLAQLREDNESQLRSLAVTCMGHLGRTHGLISGRIVACLESLLDDPKLGGIAEDALGDIHHFATVV